MHGLTATLCGLLAVVAPVSGFLVPGPSTAISGRQTYGHTSKTWISMGRGDVRTKKGKRMRHTYGKCRPKSKKKPVYHNGELVVKAAPVARRWEVIEWVESEVQPEGAPDADPTFYEAKPEASAGSVEDEAVAAVTPPEPEAVPEVAEEPVAEAVATPEADAEAVPEVPAAE